MTPELQESIATIERYLESSKKLVEQADAIRADIESRKVAVYESERALEERAKKYVVDPNESNRRYEDAIKSDEVNTKRSEELDRKESELKALEDELSKKAEDVQARLADISIEKADIRERELQLIERERDMRERIKKELVDNLK